MPTRPTLKGLAAARLEAFEDPKALGASRQLTIAAELLVAAARDYQGTSVGLVRHLNEIADYLIARRGASSQAAPNALRAMLAGLDERSGFDVDLLRAWVIQRVLDYDADARRAIRRIVERGATLLAGLDRLLLYDYSSSVAAIARELAGRGERPTIVIPEARTLDGGRRYVEDLADTPLPLAFVPDAAIGSAMRDCGAALIGAETISADGGCFNTAGSLLVALAARHWDVPLYVPSTLVKIDARTLHGDQRPIPELGRERLARLTAGWPAAVANRSTVSALDLDFVPPDLITAYITEAGVLEPAAIRDQTARMTPREGARGDAP
jgi:ribose 1,5-bisphosphate isomerase